MDTELIEKVESLRSIGHACFPLKITEAVLSEYTPEIRVKILKIWLQTLRGLRVEVFPEAAHINDLIKWLDSVAESL